MVYDNEGALIPFNFSQIKQQIPLLKDHDLGITVISFPQPLDSSNVSSAHWADIGYIVYQNYRQYDGFVILHGTDTMAYTASALSFMLEGLNKPVILTGAQLPIGAMRSDARENLFTSIEIASAKKDGHPKICEVCIFFDNHLLRGNRAKKVRSSEFSAFASENHPPLATAGIKINYNYPHMKRPYQKDFSLNLKDKFDNNVAVLKLFPNISEALVKSILTTKGLKGVVMETYGSGNAPTEKWFYKALEKAISSKIIVMNVSQCIGGNVIQGRYETSKQLQAVGVLSGRDITMEAAITKMMLLLGEEKDHEAIKAMLITPLAGEMA